MSGVSRRDFLKMSTGAVMLGAGGSALAACGSSSGTTTTTATTGTTPPHTIPRGGTLQVALTGGDASDTVDGQKGVDNVDFARIVSLYDALVVWDLDCTPRYTLADTIEPNKDATVWTIKLRKGVEFHNGKPLTAEDVIYSYQRVVSGNLGGASSLASCDVKNMKALDSLTVQIPCHVPFATFVTSIIGYYYYLSILPVGFDAKHPVGTGPFMFESFTPGEESVFTRNPHYWDAPLPYIDKLVITDYATESSQVSSLLSGQADCVNLLSVASIKTVKSGGANILVSKSAGMTPVTMRVDTAPFSDVNVRQALRLCVDREEMLKLIFGGNGLLGNDIYGYADPAYDHQIPQRVQDIDKAKSLLRQAGQENLQVTLTAAPIAQGTVQLAQVFAEQASQAGIKVNVDLTTPGVEFGPNYAKFLFAQDYVIYTTYLTQIALSGLPSSPFPETHFNDPHYTDLFNQALATVDTTARYEIEHEMMLIDWNQNGSIIPYFYPTIDGYTSHVHGVHTSVTGWPLGGYDFKSMWLS